MPYLYKTTPTTPIDLGEVAYEALVSVNISPRSAQIQANFGQYKSDGTFVRSRSAILNPPLPALRDFLEDVTALARAQGELEAGSDSVETVDE